MLLFTKLQCRKDYAICGSTNAIGIFDGKTQPKKHLSVKRTFAIRFHYLLMNAVALRPVSESF